MKLKSDISYLIIFGELELGARITEGDAGFIDVWVVDVAAKVGANKDSGWVASHSVVGDAG